MAEAALLIVVTDAQGSGTALGGGSDLEETSDLITLVDGARSRWKTCDTLSQERGRWARTAAQLGLLSEQPAPAPTLCER